MKLTHPFEPLVVAQYFGGNGAYYQEHGINIIGHNGVDFKAYHGQPVYATHDGDATYEIDENSGHMVAIINKSSGIRTIYLHLCDPVKEPHFKSPIDNNQVNPVKTGDLVGYADNTGFTTGDHLHFGLKLVNQRGEFLNTGNGYGGAIDPLPYFADPSFLQVFPCSILQTSQNVKNLQLRLIALGYSIPAGATGYYGEQTRKAVYAFQCDRLNLSFFERYVLLGTVVGPKTLNALS